MKKEQRLPYLILTTIECGDGGMATLCSFCKYGDQQGWDCSECYFECKHPLAEMQRISENIWDDYGKDCWGFRPKYTREDCVDMVGIWLQGQAVDMTNVLELGGKKGEGGI